MGVLRSDWPMAVGYCLTGLGLAGMSAAGGDAAVAVGALVAMLALVAVAPWLGRRHPRTGGILALGIGTVGIVAGVAAGVRFMGVDGAAAHALGGLVTLAGGVLLLAAGGLAITRGVRRRMWLPLVTVMVVGVVAEGYLVAPGLLAVNVVRVEVGPETPASLGIRYQDVTLRSADGLALTAWYVPSRNGAAVVVLHGTASNKAGVLDHLGVLAAAGFGVLAPDLRGEGGSGGRAMDYGWDSDLDIRAAVDYLAAQPDIDQGRIGVVGISLGGMQAIGAAGEDPRIAAVVAEGPTRRVAADLAWLPDADGLPGAVRLLATELQFGVTTLLDTPPPPLAASVAASGRTRFLLITADLRDEVLSARSIRDAAPERVAVWTVPGAGHAGGLATDPAAWTSTVTGFLAEALRGGS